MTGIDAFPLSWPTGWKRSNQRKRSRFDTSFARARDLLFKELRLLGCLDRNIVISSNIPLRRDGLPYSGIANPKDPGVAVYFKLGDKPFALACDQYIKVTDNLYAITKTVEAMRGIERWGASEMMERSFTGFAALPPPATSWHEVLRVPVTASREEIRAAYLDLAKANHPDHGGTVEAMAKINSAYETAMERR